MSTFPPAIYFFLGALASVVATEWLRHRPNRLRQGTQHIFLIGYSVASALVGVGVVALAIP